MQAAGTLLNSYSLPKDSNEKKMKFAGHRGAMAEEPENTLKAIRKAFERGAAGAEFDLQRTCDDEMVVLHDNTLKRTAKFQQWSPAVPPSIFHSSAEEYQRLLNTPVEQLSFAEVNSICLGDDEEDTAVPLHAALELLVEATKKRKEHGEPPFYLIEIKKGDVHSPQLVADIIEKACFVDGAPLKGLLDPSRQLKIIGMDIEVVKEAKKHLSTLQCLHVSKPATPMEAYELIDMAVAAGIDGVDFCAIQSAVTESVVATAHAKGLEVIVWESTSIPGLDTAPNWYAMQRNGVDVFTSSMPTALYEWDGGSLLESHYA